MDHTLLITLIFASFTFTLGAWGWLWIELKASRAELIMQIDEVKYLLENVHESLTRHEALQEGQGLEDRITRLERKVIGMSESRRQGGNRS